MKERVLAYGKSTQLTSEELGAVGGGKNIFHDIFKDLTWDRPSLNFSGHNSCPDGNFELRVHW